MPIVYAAFYMHVTVGDDRILHARPQMLLCLGVERTVIQGQGLCLPEISDAANARRRQLWGESCSPRALPACVDSARRWCLQALLAQRARALFYANHQRGPRVHLKIGAQRSIRGDSSLLKPEVGSLLGQSDVREQFPV